MGPLWNTVSPWYYCNRSDSRLPAGCDVGVRAAGGMSKVGMVLTPASPINPGLLFAEVEGLGGRPLSPGEALASILGKLVRMPRNTS